MNLNDIFCKTAKGQAEIESRSHGLSMKHRRVLILANGSNNLAELTRLSLCENAPEILQLLIADGFIESGTSSSPGTSTAAQDYSTQKIAARDSSPVSPEYSSRAGELMCNTLLTFANRVRVGKLVEEIRDTSDLDTLKELVKPWYRALSETPGGMYQADELRDEVRRLIDEAQSA